MATTQIRLDTQALDNTLIDSKIVMHTITLDKLASIGDGNIIVGAPTTGFPYAVTASGDATISDLGVISIGPGAIVNSQISVSAAISYSKLNLSNSIVNADISSVAAIALSKLAALNPNIVPVTNGSGILTSSLTTATELGYVSGVTSSIQTQLNSKVTSTLASGDIFVGNALNVAVGVPLSGDVSITNTGVASVNNIQNQVITDAMVNNSASIALSKLADGTNILLADVSKSIQDTVRYTYVTAQTFVNPGDLVDKAYVDANTIGLTVKAPVRLATTGRLVALYNNGTNGVGATLTSTTNGALSLDGVLTVVADRVLVKDQGEIDLNITGFVGTTEIDVVDNAGVQIGDTIAQALDFNITLVASSTELDVIDNTGVSSGDTINQGSFFTTVISVSPGKIFVDATAGFTTGAAYDLTQKHYHRTLVTSLGGSTQIFVASNVGFYTGTGGDPNDALHIDNGIYTVTQVGSVSLPWIITRATDFDGSSPNGVVAPGDYTFVTSGNTQATSSWVVSDTGFSPITVGVNDITWVQFNSSNTYQAGSGLTLTGNVFNVVSSNGGIVVNAHDIALTLADSTLTIVPSGLKLSPLPDTNILIGNVSNVATAHPISGDATLSDTGVLTVVMSTVVASHVVIREVPTGLINSSNTNFILAATPIIGTECVYLNGLLQNVGGSNDYTISGATITFDSAPITGSVILVNYYK